MTHEPARVVLAARLERGLRLVDLDFADPEDVEQLVGLDTDRAASRERRTRTAPSCDSPSRRAPRRSSRATRCGTSPRATSRRTRRCCRSRRCRAGAIRSCGRAAGSSSAPPAAPSARRPRLTSGSARFTLAISRQDARLAVVDHVLPRRRPQVVASTATPRHPYLPRPAPTPWPARRS